MSAPTRQDLTFRTSRRLLACQLAAHAFGAAAVLLATLPVWLKVALLLGVGASIARVRAPLPGVALRLDAEGGLELVDRQGQPGPLELEPATTVWPFLVVIVFRREGRRGVLALAPDSMDADDFRRLRVWLRWRAAHD